MEFGMDFDQTATEPSRVVTRNWLDMEFPWEFMSYFFQGWHLFFKVSHLMGISMLQLRSLIITEFPELKELAVIIRLFWDDPSTVSNISVSKLTCELALKRMPGLSDISIYLWSHENHPGKLISFYQWLILLHPYFPTSMWSVKFEILCKTC